MNFSFNYFSLTGGSVVVPGGAMVVVVVVLGEGVGKKEAGLQES